MGSFKTSLACTLLFLALSYAQDGMDEGFDLPELPPPAPVQPAPVSSDSAEGFSNAPIAAETVDTQPAQLAPAADRSGNKSNAQNYSATASQIIKTQAKQQPAPTQQAAPVQEYTTEPAQAPASAGTANAVVKKIPDNLNRDVRVGVFINVPTLFVKVGGEEIKITAVGNQLTFKGKDNSETVENREIYSEGRCLNIAETQKKLSSSCYPGYFFIKASNSKITAINMVNVEDYIRGVIPYEIGKLDSSRFEALKAQAVATRTYVYKHFGTRDAMGFDVYADTKDQVYNGYRSATPLTDAAVKATEGEVLTYNGAFIVAYYHSTCGGQTETMVTWEKKNLPYLKSSPDLRPNGQPWCNESKFATWEKKFTEKELVSLFQKNGKEAKASVPKFKKVRDIAIRKKLPSGRIYTLQVLTDKGTFNVTGDKVRWLFKKNGTILPSSLFSVHHEGKNWVLKGKGYGHGVGLCQMGVRERAHAGQGYFEILSHYYPGVTLERFER